ncbi:tetratricopeptide repeat protein [Niveispirillum irakense]|uniref:tetratricopeptide repeat protein n=1 Tax=Niveispirillum irakense TaxID=34011 RepID=UPI0012B64D0F|nr:tetratricopeptide repeat protein [Niveispirillum irakense]
MLRRVALAMASGFMPRDPAHRGGALFLIGAGCSRSAGVPLGWEVAGIACAMMAEKLAPADMRDRFTLLPDLSKNEIIFEEALEFLKDKALLGRGTSLATEYSHIFEQLFSDQSQQNEVISKALEFGRNRINWAHICLGQLVHERYVHTVLTTNFDTLILDGIVRCGTIPAVSDSLDTINRIRGKSRHPQLVHLHGSRHAYSQYNKAADLTGTADRDDLKQMIAELLRDSTALVVVGYAGGEEAVMRHLGEAVKRYPDKPIFWVTKGTSLESQSPATRTLLSDHDRTRKPRYFMGDWDADDFFRALMQQLTISLPNWMLDPVQFWMDRSEEIVKPSNVAGTYENTITSLIDDYTRRLQQLKDCQTHRVVDAPSEIAEKIRQHIAAGNVGGAWQEIEAAVSPDSYQGVLVEILHFTAENAKPSGDHDLMEKVLWCIDQIHHLIDAQGSDWTGIDDALSEIYDIFLSFSWAGYPERIREHAVETAKAGVERRLKLAGQEPARFNAALADGWHQLSILLADVGDTPSALDAATKAIAIREKLAAENPARFNSDLAGSLNNLSLCLSDAGDGQGALAAVTKTVGIYEKLVAENPARFNPDLAGSLNNLSNCLSAAGDGQGALDAIAKAVAIYEKLAAENPARFNPDWAISLNNLSLRLSDVGDGKGALDAIAKTVGIYEKLVAENPARFNPDLALSLNNLSSCLSDAGDGQGALAAIAKAVAIVEKLAAENPARFNPDLASSLNNLSVHLSVVGDVKGALGAIAKAVAIREKLAAENPARFNPDLAASLANLALRTAENGDQQEAIRLMERAITLITPQATAYPDSQAGRWLAQMQKDLARFRQSGA